jgi:hypothetical protein
VLAAKFASGWLLARNKFLSVSCQLDANFIKLAAIRMQISFSRPPAGCKLHLASGHAIQNTQFACGQQPVKEICILLAASQMQILQK